jgi:hypothetical protein
MTYKINTTDGNLLTDLPDGTFDTSSTSLTLVGKNSVNFGEAINENFVKLLESFASTSPPEQAIRGQIWYNTNSGRLNVYDGTNFKSTGGPIISPLQPSNLIAGDLWINNENNQLWFYDGTDLMLAGPSYTKSQGVSGLKIESVFDSFSRLKTVASLYVNNVLLGIFSKEAFLPLVAITGYGPKEKPINVGFNAGELVGLKFDVTAARADAILTDDGIPKTASEIIFSNEDAILYNDVTIQNDNGFSIGITSQVQQFMETSSAFVIENTKPNGNITLKVKATGAALNAVFVKGADSRIGIFNNNPQYTLDVSGDLRVTGNLVVDGDTVTLNTSVLTVEDKNIVIAQGVTTDGVGNDGAGITVKGTTDKTISFNSTTFNWDLSENINIPAGKTFKINQVSILSETTLAPSVVTSSLTSVGELIDLKINSGLYLNDDQISAHAGDISLLPASGFNISASGTKLIDVAEPEALTDAATKNYIDRAVYGQSLVMTLDISGLPEEVYAQGTSLNTKIADLLDIIAPYKDPTIPSSTGIVENGAIMRLHCTASKLINSDVTVDTSDINKSTISVINNDTSQPTPIIEDFTINPLSAPTAVLTVFRQNKLFTMINDHWQFTENIGSTYSTQVGLPGANSQPYWPDDLS